VVCRHCEDVSGLLIVIEYVTAVVGRQLANGDSACSRDAFLDANKLAKIHLTPFGRHVLATGNAEHTHALVITQPCQELGRDQEVLRCVLSARDLDHTFVNHTLVARVHTLVDLINDSERCLGHGLQCHQIEDGRHRAFAARLSMLVKLLQGLILSRSPYRLVVARN